MCSNIICSFWLSTTCRTLSCHPNFVSKSECGFFSQMDFLFLLFQYITFQRFRFPLEWRIIQLIVVATFFLSFSLVEVTVQIIREMTQCICIYTTNCGIHLIYLHCGINLFPHEWDQELHLSEWYLLLNWISIHGWLNHRVIVICTKALSHYALFQSNGKDHFKQGDMWACWLLLAD